MSVLNPRQLQMFMKPSEVRAMPNFRYGDGMGMNEAELREWKLSESDAEYYDTDEQHRPPGSLTSRIEAEGVKEPMAIMHEPSVGPELWNGHHRFFVQERREKRGEEVYLPIEHRSPWSS